MTDSLHIDPCYDFDIASRGREGAAVNDRCSASEFTKFFYLHGELVGCEQGRLQQVYDSDGSLESNGFLGKALAVRSEKMRQHAVQQSAGPRQLGRQQTHQIQIEGYLSSNF
jgi:hypothetical protein